MSNMSFKTYLLLAAAVFCLSHQVSSLQCYFCSTEVDEECYSNPKQSKFENSCPNYMSFTRFDFDSMFIQTHIASLPIGKDKSSERFSYECGTIVAGFPGQKAHTIRACLVAEVSCEEYKALLEQRGIEVKSCSKCGSDFCNSSNK